MLAGYGASSSVGAIACAGPPGPPSVRAMQHGAPRRSLLRPLLAAVAVLAIVIGAVWFFVLRDDDGDSGDDPGAGSGATELAEQTFAVDGVPFTFAFPGDFAPAQAPEGIIWVAGISPVDILDVKRIADEELGPVRLKQTVRQTLRETTGVTISGEGTAQAGSTSLVSFTIDNTGSGTPLRSVLYYFAAGGSTWQLECQSQADNQAAIDAACARAVQTLSVG